jgi:hypothetical protein
MTACYVLPPRKRRRYPHVIEQVEFKPRRFLLCSCGHLIENAASDDEQGDAFRHHRLANGAKRHI